MIPWIGEGKSLRLPGERLHKHNLFFIFNIEIPKMKVAYKNLTKGGGNKKNEFTLTFGER